MKTNRRLGAVLAAVGLLVLAIMLVPFPAGPFLSLSLGDLLFGALSGGRWRFARVLLACIAVLGFGGVVTGIILLVRSSEHRKRRSADSNPKPA